MENLVDFYNDLKSQMDPKAQDTEIQNRSKEVWRNNMVTKRDNLVDNCAKRIIVDIYHHTLPLDDQYKDCNPEMISDDVGSMLDKKNMTSMQYFKSAYDQTHAPLLEFVIRSLNEIGRQYQEDAMEDLKDKEEKGLPLTAVDPNEDKVDSQLLEIKNDSEYEAFMDALKKKTIDKIVSDVSSLIDDKKESGDMEFNSDETSDSDTEEPKLESVVVNAVNYLARQKLITEAAGEKNNFNGEDTSAIPGNVERAPIGIAASSLDDIDLAKVNPSVLSLVDRSTITKANDGALIFPTNQIGGKLADIISGLRTVFANTMVHVYSSDKVRYNDVVSAVALGVRSVKENKGFTFLYEEGYPRVVIDMIGMIEHPVDFGLEEPLSAYLNTVCAQYNQDAGTKYGVKVLHWTRNDPGKVYHVTAFAFNEGNEQYVVDLLQQELPNDVNKSWIRRIIDKILGRSSLTQDQQIGTAVREATMVEMERTFNQINGKNYKTYLEHLSHGNGYVIHR